MNLVELFCHVDDFCQAFEGHWIRHQLTTGRRRRRTGQLCLSEIMTLLIWFHQSHYRDFKAFYQHHVCRHLRDAFPGLVSYGRFVELMPSTLIPLCTYLRQCQGVCTGISFIDSTRLAVCHPRRRHQHRLFTGQAQWGKSSTGWFFGFKLHLVVNERGQLLNVALTPGPCRVVGRTPTEIRKICEYSDREHRRCPAPRDTAKNHSAHRRQHRKTVHQIEVNQCHNQDNHYTTDISKSHADGLCKPINESVLFCLTSTS